MISGFSICSHEVNTHTDFLQPGIIQFHNLFPERGFVNITGTREQVAQGRVDESQVIPAGKKLLYRIKGLFQRFPGILKKDTRQQRQHMPLNRTWVEASCPSH